jgi:hypothetical protein
MPTGGKCQCRTHHRKRAVCWRRLWRGVGICVRVRERGPFNVSVDRRERKNARRRRRSKKVGTKKKTRGRRGGSVNADEGGSVNADEGGSVNAVRTTGFRRCVATPALQSKPFAIGENLASVGGEGGVRCAVRYECFFLSFSFQRMV